MPEGSFHDPPQGVRPGGSSRFPRRRRSKHWVPVETVTQPRCTPEVVFANDRSHNGSYWWVADTPDTTKVQQ